MMILGIIIFAVGLFLILDCRNQVSNHFCKREDNALNILKERYVRGEITTDEFRTMKSVLSDD